MDRTRLIGLLLAASLWTTSAAAQERPPSIVELTYDGALALAREHSPALAAARARAREAEREVDAAAVRRFNPQLTGTAGPRVRSDGTLLDWSIGVQQWLELGGQRGDRVAAARAGAEAGTAHGEDARRRLLRDVGLAFVAALYWERRVELAQEDLRIAKSIAHVATRRHEVGDAGGLEPTVSAVATARARGDVERARAALTQAEGRLKALLGIEAATELVCRGDLRRLGVLDVPEPDLGDRPDLRALRANVRRAEADVDLGRAGRVPNIAVGAGYARDDAADVVRGTLTVALPVFDRGQGTTAVARARAERLRTELDAAASTAAVEIETAEATVQTLSDAARRFEQEGLGALERSEQLATASYEAGAIPLPELLAVRRELVQAKLDHAELLLGAATARVELAASTGALR
ncbi:TolC family protein [Paraliomyxa miuraensis]|uniref:TolC family protein n=1 Tax=Paraliomyxa miuraensis TaxID=376150 RepID=UPI002256B1D8|nr:TolC family protein [Paraliomyxa miuraensis]MCX4242580.1 TolC family protein [Paraliomyxa miuraensis]